jgi:hypothetical protein
MTSKHLVVAMQEKIYFIETRKIKTFDIKGEQNFLYRENRYPVGIINLSEMFLGKQTLKFGYKVSKVPIQNNERLCVRGLIGTLDTI